MKFKFIIPLVTLVLFSTFGISQEKDAYSFIVTINGQEQTIKAGEEISIPASSETSSLTVRLADYKSFETSSISFNYPNNYGYKLEKSYGYRNHEIDGNDFSIMFFEIDAETELDQLVNSMAKQFGRKNCKITKTSMKLGSKTLEGKRIDVSLVGQFLSIDMLELPGTDYKSRILAFQDLKKDKTTQSEESISTLKKIKESIKYSEVIK